jgi:hypothetical protein
MVIRNTGFSPFQSLSSARQTAGPARSAASSRTASSAAINPRANSASSLAGGVGNSSFQGIFQMLLSLFSQLFATLGNGGLNNNLNPEFIDGSTGPFNPGTNGGFGRNAAINRSQLEAQGLFDPNRTSVQYTSSTNPQFSDLFGYSEEAIADRDANQDGVLSVNEFAARFSNRNEANTMFGVLDSNQDNVLDTVEIAALGILTDSNGDGVITPTERNNANTFIFRAPAEAASTVDSIIGALNLENRYNQFVNIQASSAFLNNGFNNLNNFNNWNDLTGIGFNPRSSRRFNQGNFNPFLNANLFNSRSFGRNPFGNGVFNNGFFNNPFFGNQRELV